jgi:hypothetical protein
MKLTKDEKIAHANARRTHRETTESLKKSRGKVYSLLLGQCTQYSSAGRQDEAGRRLDDDRQIVRPNPIIQVDGKICSQAIQQPVQDGSVNSQAAINPFIPPR